MRIRCRNTWAYINMAEIVKLQEEMLVQCQKCGNTAYEVSVYADWLELLCTCGLRLKIKCEGIADIVEPQS